VDVSCLIYAGGHPGEVAEEEREDGSDEDDGEVAVPGLLGGAPLPQLVCVGVAAREGLAQLQAAPKVPQADQNP